MPEPLQITPSAVVRLVAAHRAYGSHQAYDEVLHEVSSRAEANGFVSKSDVGALLFWKRLRANSPWVTAFLNTEASVVQATTAAAFQAARDLSLSIPEAAIAARRELTSLPGFDKGDAMASAVILACAPSRMAVYDTRADAGLKLLLDLSLGTARGRYGRYMAAVDSLTEAVNSSEPDALWIPRDVDLALFTLGKPAES